MSACAQSGRASSNNLNQDSLTKVTPEADLLPYSIRLQKLSLLFGIAKDDSRFDKLNENRFELGAYVYAEGIPEDRSITADKITSWVEALVPLCASGILEGSYTLPADLGKLIQDIYGRKVETSEITTLSELYSSAGDPTLGYQRVCLVLLTSAEFLM